MAHQKPGGIRYCGMISAAVVLSIIAIILVIFALITPAWLAADRNRVSKPIAPFPFPFDSMGLWQCCWRLDQIVGPSLISYSRICGGFWSRIPRFAFSTPVFFIVTQVLYTTGCVLSIVGMFLMTAVCCRWDKRVTKIMLCALGGLFVMAGTFICASWVIFAARVFNQEYTFGLMADFFSYSFSAAVAGGLFLLISGTLFLIEGRRAAYSNKQ